MPKAIGKYLLIASIILCCSLSLALPPSEKEPAIKAKEKAEQAKEKASGHKHKHKRGNGMIGDLAAESPDDGQDELATGEKNMKDELNAENKKIKDEFKDDEKKLKQELSF